MMTRTLLTACLACAALHAQAAGPTIVITGATLIDGTGAQPVRDSVIVISDGYCRLPNPVTDSDPLSA